MSETSFYPRHESSHRGDLVYSKQAHTILEHYTNHPASEFLTTNDATAWMMTGLGTLNAIDKQNMPSDVFVEEVDELFE